uniref:NADH-ubiquinone oxidoreductase chain 6 n=1 Tax=Coleoptera sp. ACP-2013 TaxID=2485033 RepID=A0A3G3MEF6_9COLE|nr:NADH dehydrogenase subunit 6 [Coleoptera sp. ACP-2013]
MMMILMMFFSLTFMLMHHPLSFGLLLMLQTIFIAMMTGMMNLNYWFSYILFLIMVGGMLILFIYMTSIASNEKFKINTNIIIISMFLIIIFMMMNFNDNFYLNFMFKFKNNSLNLSLMKYYNFPNMILMILMIIYLFITLIMVVKITNLTFGPLRQKF